MAGESYQSADTMYEELRTEIGAEGDAAPFLFSGRDSVFSDLGFISNGNKMRGYFVFINGQQSDFILMAFSGISLYEETHDFLLSVLTSVYLSRSDIPVERKRAFLQANSGEKEKTTRLTLLMRNFLFVTQISRAYVTHPVVENLVSFHKLNKHH